jgi:hypothetical protein
MTFIPALPASGTAGLSFLDRTMAAQRRVHDAQPDLRRDEAYFRDRIGRIKSAADLVADPRLLRVALTAFGLEADVGNRFFIRKVLEEGTLNPTAFANRLADKRYRALSAAFGFGDFAVPNTVLSDFPDRILEAWKTRRFEAAVGTRDEALRLALNARRELRDLAGQRLSDNARWFTIMGNVPLRRVVETAMGLPKSFGTLNIDRQLDVLKARARSIFGVESAAALAEPERLEKLLRLYLVRAEAAGSGATQPAALQLLQRGRGV